MQILISKFYIIECISQIIKVIQYVAIAAPIFSSW